MHAVAVHTVNHAAYTFSYMQGCICRAASKYYWQGCIQNIEAGGAKSGCLLIRVGEDELFDK